MYIFGAVRTSAGRCSRSLSAFRLRAGQLAAGYNNRPPWASGQRKGRPTVSTRPRLAASAAARNTAGAAAQPSTATVQSAAVSPRMVPKAHGASSFQTGSVTLTRGAPAEFAFDAQRTARGRRQCVGRAPAPGRCRPDGGRGIYRPCRRLGHAGDQLGRDAAAAVRHGQRDGVPGLRTEHQHRPHRAHWPWRRSAPDCRGRSSSRSASPRTVGAAAGVRRLTSGQAACSRGQSAGSGTAVSSTPSSFRPSRASSLRLSARAAAPRARWPRRPRAARRGRSAWCGACPHSR